MWWEGKLYNNATISFFNFFISLDKKKKNVFHLPGFSLSPSLPHLFFYINVCNDCSNYRRMLWSSRRNFLFCFYPHWITFLHTIIKTKLYIEKQVPHVLFFPFSRCGTCVCPLFFLSLFIVLVDNTHAGCVGTKVNSVWDTILFPSGYRNRFGYCDFRVCDLSPCVCVCVDKRNKKSP